MRGGTAPHSSSRRAGSCPSLLRPSYQQNSLLGGAAVVYPKSGKRAARSGQEHALDRSRGRLERTSSRPVVLTPDRVPKLPIPDARRRPDQELLRAEVAPPLAGAAWFGSFPVRPGRVPFPYSLVQSRRPRRGAEGDEIWQWVYQFARRFTRVSARASRGPSVAPALIRVEVPVARLTRVRPEFADDIPDFLRELAPVLCLAELIVVRVIQP